MPANIGTYVIAPIVTPDSADVYPTHYSSDGCGGLHHVASLVERDAIPAERRKEGMLCAVAGDLTYSLAADLTTWNPTSLSGGVASGASWDIQYNNVSPLTGPEIPAGSRLVTVTCEVVIAFNGSGAAVQIGLSPGTTNAVFDVATLDVSAVGIYEVAVTVAGPVSLTANITPGLGASQGHLRIQTQVTGA